MEISRAVNIAVSCVMGSALDRETKQEVIDTVRRLETLLGEISDPKMRKESGYES
ncbi:hypothetical protein NST17_20375 [Caldifermentibacillus hisashii]|uniref:Uncharacterized protein n=1 Tax=Caldifermentibacillus hisashii TaxID=996558 RepID=A0ABU9K306_9BACI